jgi:hypothetical protein
MVRLCKTAPCAAALLVLWAHASSAQDAPAKSSPTPAFDQAEAVADLKKAIAGKEELPAPEVFKNIKQYRGVTAGRLLRIMEYGFNRSLGVDCTHCHVAGQWDSDEKVTKQIARDMSAMTTVLNGDYLKKIANLKSTNASVNCTTCHRGQTRPALELPPAAKAASQQ